MSWAVWLLIPVAVTVLAALASWLRARPARKLTTRQAIQAHDEFLAALAQATKRESE